MLTQADTHICQYENLTPAEFCTRYGGEAAYALTVHRSQGSGYDTVLIPLSTAQMGNMLYRNLLYTAITRAKRRAILYCADGALDRAIRTPPPYRRSRLVEKVKEYRKANRQAC